jgi:hypothetical protein
VYFLGLTDATKGIVGWKATSDRENSATERKTRHLGAGIRLQLPALTPDIIPCEHAWVVVLTGLANF